MNNKIAIYVFVDALGWDIYQHYGFLNDLLTHSRKLETTFGFSSAADPSILTGRYPDAHTHWSSYIYDPDNSPFRLMKLLTILPKQLTDRWRIRHNLSKLIKLSLGYTGYFQLYRVPFNYLLWFDYLEKRDYFIPGGILQTDTIFDWCVQKQIPYYCSDWRHNEELVLRENLQVIGNAQSKFNYVYFPRLDAVMHEFGPFSPQTQGKLSELEQKVTKLYRYACKVYNEVSLYLISDHGMAPVTGYCDVMGAVENTGLSYGKDYVAFYDSTMARFWFLNPDSKPIIVQALSGLTSGKIVSEAELKKMHVYFDHNKFGDLYYLMQEGFLINPSFMSTKMIAGMHGYHPEDKHSYAVISSNRKIPSHINSITDIRCTMENELVTG